jgi:hypothetical protein
MIDLLKERLLPEGLLEDAAPSNNTTIEDQAAGQPDVASRKLSDRQEQAVVVSIQSGLPYTERKSTFQVGEFVTFSCELCSPLHRNSCSRSKAWVQSCNLRHMADGLSIVVKHICFETTQVDFAAHELVHAAFKSSAKVDAFGT